MYSASMMRAQPLVWLKNPCLSGVLYKSMKGINMHWSFFYNFCSPEWHF